jgi:hypothetical protein
MQWEGDPAEPVPLLGLWTPGRTPVLCEPPPAEAFTMQGYAGSIAATATRVLITSPKGGAAMLFAQDGSHVATHHRSDLCGAAALADRFMLTDGFGALWLADDSDLALLARDAVQWDNHLVALG